MGGRILVVFGLLVVAGLVAVFVSLLTSDDTGSGDAALESDVDADETDLVPDTVPPVGKGESGLLAPPGAVPVAVEIPPLGRVRPIDLVPERAELIASRRIGPGGGLPPQILVHWRRVVVRNGFGSPLGDAGISLWRRGRGGWRSTFQIHENYLAELRRDCAAGTCYSATRGGPFYQPAFEAKASVGPPARSSSETLPCDFTDTNVKMKIVDLTRDGRDDVFLFEGGCGSGFVGVWRVIATEGTRTRQIFRRLTGDTTIKTVRGNLRMRAAVFRRDDSHCCPSFYKFTTLRWNGERFAQTRTRRVKTDL